MGGQEFDNSPRLEGFRGENRLKRTVALGEKGEAKSKGGRPQKEEKIATTSQLLEVKIFRN